MVSVRSLLTASALVAVASAANHTIVAQADLTFNPSEITADEGDWLIFQFQSGNHSAVSGPFTSPCEPATSGGFFSGHFPTDSGTNANQFAVQVTNASAPIWFYCAQARHCANGMVGVVNPTTARTLDMYKAAAKTFGKAAVAPASVAGGVVESTDDDNDDNDDNDDRGAAASLRVSMAAAVIGLFGAAALMA